MTRAGRIPPCSRPTWGSKSMYQTSPALGSCVFGTDRCLLLGGEVGLFILETVHRTTLQKPNFVHIVLPCDRIGSQTLIILMHTFPILLTLIALNQFSDDITHRTMLFLRDFLQLGVRGEF